MTTTTDNSATQTEELAIIRKPRVEVEDHCGELCVVFTTNLMGGMAACQWVSPTSPEFQSLWLAMKGDVANLEGKPCIVLVRDNRHIFVFDRMADL